ncbi:MAG TPA: phosphatase PAP2 family protein [Candidatus Binataceae bacterium]|nr:phosphatase PAP2 family protein [Candidatus Binataceae bacterium]
MCRALTTLVLALAVGAAATSPAIAQSAFSRTGGEVASDFKYLVNNVADDAIDVATSPLYVGEAGEVLASPRFYLVVGGAGALWGGSFALDQTMRSHLRSMSSSDADLLQNISYASVSGGTALLYGYGLYAGDARARHYALTAGEGAGIATLLDIGIKAAFGRQRPSQSSSHTAFFHGGQSFVSGDVTPMFALAAGVSEYYDNRWYIAAPVYSLALLDGFGRMGHDAHWFSDVVGAALLGVATTELFIYLHRKHEEDPSGFKIFAMPAPIVSPRNQLSGAPAGLGIAFSW